MKKIFALDLQKKFLWGGFAVIGMICFGLSFQKTEQEPTTFATAPSVDTFIPVGYVLVPIELVNAESLSSLVGDVGCVVDLYLANNEKRPTALKVGSKIKMVRAPLNPQQYAVLVKDQESSAILNYSGPFLAVVQNPNAQGQEIKSGERKKTLRIEYQPTEN